MEHMKGILEIERLSFKYSWSQSHFMKMMRQRNIVGRVLLSYNHKTLSKVEEGTVIEMDQLLTGYIINRLYKTHTEIIRLATAPDARRRGVGRLLVSETQQRLNSSISKRKKIVADVPDMDLVPQLFFRACGFVAHQLSDNETYRFECFRSK
jgi:ribosomal-protein-alanine N-acetyltransferase